MVTLPQVTMSGDNRRSAARILKPAGPRHRQFEDVLQDAETNDPWPGGAIDKPGQTYTLRMLTRLK